MTSKTSFDARIKQRFLGMRGSAADAVVTSGKAVGREQECSAAFRGCLHVFCACAEWYVHEMLCFRGNLHFLPAGRALS